VDVDTTVAQRLNIEVAFSVANAQAFSLTMDQCAIEWLNNGDDLCLEEGSSSGEPSSSA
jgi:hypothetical protein